MSGRIHQGAIFGVELPVSAMWLSKIHVTLLCKIQHCAQPPAPPFPPLQHTPNLILIQHGTKGLDSRILSSKLGPGVDKALWV